MLQILQQKAYQQTSAASVAVFRMGFGFIMLWEVWRYWNYGWIHKYYIKPEFFFKYYGFEWVQPWTGEGMYIHFAVMGILALFVMLGVFYRISIVLFTLAFSYVFLLDQTRYLNHFYLVILFSTLFCVVPAHKVWSFDAWRRRRRTELANSKATIPWWSIWILRIQMEIMLIYAGIVKINPDWLQLEPLRMWLTERADYPYGLGYLFTQDWSIAIAAYGVILLHIVGAPLLLVKRTRLIVFCIYACFHTLNHFVFNIGIFPWFTLFASLIFFAPDWPETLAKKLKLSFVREETGKYKTAEHVSPLQQRFTIGFLILWVSSQILIPVRHLLYPGNVSWTEEGHRFSWQMKLRDKIGWSEFYVTRPGDNPETWTVDPKLFLRKKQARKMSTRPDMILQFAQYLEQLWKQEYNLKYVEVRATVYVSLNGREESLLVDPDVDLSQVKRDLGHADWILPLDKPLKTTLATVSDEQHNEKPPEN